MPAPLWERRAGPIWRGSGAAPLVSTAAAGACPGPLWGILTSGGTAAAPAPQTQGGRGCARAADI